ncbi:MAG: hypothetical protein RL375_3350 [Pseudomonadota bacterium]|jgi:hypothetical protein
MSKCSLHEIISHFDGYKLQTVKQLSFEEGVALERCIRNAENAMCFHMGTHDAIGELTIIPDLLKLPFDTCYFECDTDDYVARATGNDKFSVVATNDASGVLMSCFTRLVQPVRWKYLGAARLRIDSSLGKYMTGFELLDQYRPDGLIDYINRATSTVCKFLSALNCKNVSMVEHGPNKIIRQTIVKQGKKPLFRYWTLKLDLGPKGEQTSRGSGAHASPALHLRRGHARQYSPGLYTWVQPCIVGNKKDGIVHKDYAVH